MPIISVKKAIGESLAKSIYFIDDDGKTQTLMEEGKEIVLADLVKFAIWGIGEVYIGQKPTGIISNDTRFSFIRELKEIVILTKLRKVIDFTNLTTYISYMIRELEAKKVVEFFQNTKEEDFYYHSLNATIYSLMLGKRLGLARSSLIDLGLGAALHDLGKFCRECRDFEELDKNLGDEYKHTMVGYKYVKEFSRLNLVSAGVLLGHHGEYTHALKGMEIHKYSRIVDVANRFDMCTRGNISKGGIHKSVQELFKIKDVELVEEFFATIEI